LIRRESIAVIKLTRHRRFGQSQQLSPYQTGHRQIPQNGIKSRAFSETPFVLWTSRFGREASRVLAAQVGLAITASVVVAAIWGWAAGGWALMGGFVCVGPSALLAVRLNRAARPGGNFGAALLVGEFLKIGLVAALFALAFAKSGNVHALALLAGFIAAVHGYFLALLFK
jgi:F0F1-type ATP synthase assembly protein I